jgi:4-hydroxybenzoate polyprenyltransferase
MAPNNPDTSSSSKIEQLKSWLELIRLPNLFTVPGDSLAGFILATIIYTPEKGFSFSAELIWLILASTLIYAAGIIQNDIADIKIDSEERPKRPLPSGRISITYAKIASIIMYLTALLLISYISYKATCIALMLIGLVICYNFYLKKYMVSGAVNMGLCRGFNLLLGASIVRLKAVLEPLVLFPFLLFTTYIFFICLISYHETEPYSQGQKRWYPFFAVTIFYSAFYFCFFSQTALPSWPSSLPVILSLVTAVSACLWIFKCGYNLKESTPALKVQKMIGSFIIGLLFIQTSFIFIFDCYSLIPGLIILSFWFIMPFFRKHFYCS